MIHEVLTDYLLHNSLNEHLAVELPFLSFFGSKSRWRGRESNAESWQLMYCTCNVIHSLPFHDQIKEKRGKSEWMSHKINKNNIFLSRGIIITQMSLRLWAEGPCHSDCRFKDCMIRVLEWIKFLPSSSFLWTLPQLHQPVLQHHHHLISSCFLVSSFRAGDRFHSHSYDGKTRSIKKS